MRLSRFAFVAASAILAIGPLHASAAISVAIIDYKDSWTSTQGLGQSLTDLGQAYTDKTPEALAGKAIDLAGFDTFIIGSVCTQNDSIRAALSKSAAAMSALVKNGGTVITLTQADQNVAEEKWLPSPICVTRGDPDFDRVRRVQPKHQLFNAPEAISDEQLQGWKYQGSATWPTSWESLTGFEQVGVLAGNDPADVTLASILEAGWGKGRAMFLSLAPDKARNIGNAQAKAQAPRLMKNLLKYAEGVKAGKAAPVEVYAGGGWSGPIAGHVFLDANGNGKRDEGEAGVADVGMSDTIDLVLTAADGTYTLPNGAKNAKLLYISLPAGYAKNGRWYEHLKPKSPAAAFDFALVPADETKPFDFAQITDLHIGGAGTKELLTAGLAQIADLKDPPAFVLATGDLVNVGSVLTQYDDYAAAVAGSKVRVFSVFGNHDVNNQTSGNYRRYLGPDYYSFDYGDCHFLMVNCVQKTPEQRQWVAKDIELLRGKKRLFIFQHFAPSDEEYTEFTSYGAKAVFSGHWHSQHTVQVGQTTSYNTANLLFGGIDCSPAGFKIIHVEPSGKTSTRMKWIADGQRLQIVMPSDALVIPEGGLQILVNAYATSAETTAMRYEMKSAGAVVAEGSLKPAGEWSWEGTVPAEKAPRGAYELNVTATNDRGATSTTSTSFMVLGLRRKPVLPEQDWPQFGGGPQRGGATTATLEPPLGPVWLHASGGTFDFASPVVKDKTVFVSLKDRGDLDRNGVLALRAADGSKEWFAPTPAAVSHSVAVDETRVYACSHGGILHAFDRTTGKPVWSDILGSDSLRFQYSAPALVDGQLFAGTFAWFGRFDAATGKESWHKTYGADWISSNACPAVSGEIVVVPGNWQNKSLIAVKAASGEPLWQCPNHGLHGSPVIAGDKVVFTDYEGKIHCVELATGKEVWTRDLGGKAAASTPAVAFGTVVAGGAGSIKGFRLSDGEPLWETPLKTSALKMAPYNNGFTALAGSATIAGHTAYVPCGDGRLYALTLESGKVCWSMDFGVPLLSAPCIAGRAMYLTAYDGNVYALTARAGFEPAAGPP